MMQIVSTRQRDRQRLYEAGGGVVIKPVMGLNVVLISSRVSAARTARDAQPLKQVIRGSVFLEDDHYMLKSGNLSDG